VLAADLFLGGMIAPFISYFKVELFCGRISVIIELAVFPEVRATEGTCLLAL